MTKNKGRRRRKNSRQEEERDDGCTIIMHDDETAGTADEVEVALSKQTKKKIYNKNSDLSFAERRELQRKAAAEKRRQKMKCYLCGKTGHVRRECPGIADDGRGESKYTKSNGDAGATHLKHKGRSAKNKKHRGGDNHHSSRDTEHPLALPPGFARDTGNEGENSGHGFLYLDAGMDEGTAVLEHLRFGRHGHHGGNTGSHNPHNHTQLSRRDAIEEYDTALKRVCETTNFGGCIVRSYLPPLESNKNCDEEERPWAPTNSFPFSCFESAPSLLRFVIGIHHQDDEELSPEAMIDRLVNAATKNKERVVGFFSDLDYTAWHQPVEEGGKDPSQDKAFDSLREFQLLRLRSTLHAASRLGFPVQVRIVPGYKPCHQSTKSKNGSMVESSNSDDGYSQAIRDLGTILLEASCTKTSHATSENLPWKVHLSCWNGKADHLVALAKIFDSQRLCFGFDGRVGFSKAVHLHESAFEISPDRIVLETGGPGSLPPVVAKHGGREAFCHSGHLPFVAEEVARHLAKNPRNSAFGVPNAEETDGLEDGGSLAREIDAEMVARWASETTKRFYRIQED